MSLKTGNVGDLGAYDNYKTLTPESYTVFFCIALVLVALVVWVDLKRITVSVQRDGLLPLNLINFGHVDT